MLPPEVHAGGLTGAAAAGGFIGAVGGALVVAAGALAGASV